MSNSPLELTVLPDHPGIARATATRIRVVAEVVARAAGPVTRPPMAVVLALDVSGSMQGDKLRHLVRSVELVVDHLSPRDQIGIACFSDTARVALPLIARGAWTPAAIAGLAADGCTNIEGGLALAASLAAGQGAGMRSAIVLLSDGQPNVGANTPAALAAFTRALRETASVSTLGYGADHSDAVLAAIAEAGGGGYAYIPNPEQCRIELARVVGAQVDVVADRVRVAFEPAPGIVATTEVCLPDLCAGDRRIATFDLDLPAFATLGSTPLGRVVLHYRPAGGAPATFASPLVVDVADTAGSRDPVAHALGLVRDGELARAEATRLVDAGRFSEAAAALQRCLDQVRAAVPGAPDARLSELQEQLVDDLALIAQRPDATARAAYRRGQNALSPQYASPMLAKASGPVPKAILVMLGDRKAAPIALGRETTFGRTPSADVQLASGHVSRLHTRIVAAEGAFWVNDLGSSNGTRLNGAIVTSQRLHDGDVIEIGDIKLLFRDA
jgi:Mg-chelatase subunit ChlD